MKVRVGFVSNSSSSSFMMVVKEDDFTKAMEDLHPFWKHMLNRWFTVGQFAGEQVMYGTENISTEDPDVYGYEGEVLDMHGEIIGTMSEDDDWYNGEDYPANRGDALDILSRKLKELDADHIYLTYC